MMLFFSGRNSHKGTAGGCALVVKEKDDRERCSFEVAAAETQEERNRVPIFF